MVFFKRRREGFVELQDLNRQLALVARHRWQQRVRWESLRNSAGPGRVSKGDI